MPDNGPQASGKPAGRGAFVFALTALAACWNALAAPLGLLVGLATVVLSVRALRRAHAGQRRWSAAALACSVAAVIASATTLALTAGAVSLDLPGEPVVKARSQAELDTTLSEAAERTRTQREQAQRELGNVAAKARERPPARGGGRDAGPAQDQGPTR